MDFDLTLILFILNNIVLSFSSFSHMATVTGSTAAEKAHFNRRKIIGLVVPILAAIDHNLKCPRAEH